jgi:Putative peptidoglycan binding domain
MPRDDMPRRRRGAHAVAIEPDAERGLVMRILLHSPKDMAAGALAFAAVSAIIANALWLQAGRHPSPMFRASVAMPAAPVAAANPLPRPRPLDADVTAFEAKLNEPKAPDAPGNLVKTNSAPAAVPAAVARPPAPIPAASRADAIAGSGSRRVAAVQRTLTEYGYGQLKPTGTVGSDTQTAIQKFERARKIPVTGQMSDRLVQELTAVIGHPID